MAGFYKEYAKSCVSTTTIANIKLLSDALVTAGKERILGPAPIDLQPPLQMGLNVQASLILTY
jgi:hypothetical protein